LNDYNLLQTTQITKKFLEQYLLPRIMLVSKCVAVVNINFVRHPTIYDELVILECDSRHSLLCYFFRYPNLIRHQTSIFYPPCLLLGRSTEAQSYHSSDKHSSRGRDNRDSHLPPGLNWTRLSGRGSLIWTLPHGRHHPHTKRWRLSSGQLRLYLWQEFFWAHNCSSSCTYNWLLYCRGSFHPPSGSERRLRSDVVDQVRNATSMCCWLVGKQHLQDLGDLLVL